ncbi:MAG: hypothetical protein NVS4B3_03020 [Gemmatimonadaceae bacterium]
MNSFPQSVAGPTEKPCIHGVTPRDVVPVLDGFPSRFLSPQEQELFGELPPNKRPHDWLAGRLAAKRAVRALQYRLGEDESPWTAVSVLNAPTGAPCLAVSGRPDIGMLWNISIAHADGFAICAIARTAVAGYVGVDFEPERALTPDLLQYILTDAEQSQLRRSALRATSLPLAIWTAKGAVVKAARGVCTAMQDVELSWPNGLLNRRWTARLVGGDPASRLAAFSVSSATWRSHRTAWATCRLDEAA